MATYQLKINLKAQCDLDDIYTNGFYQWGEAQADLYYDKLITRFDELAEQPALYQAVDHIRAGYRRSVCGVHAIYYRIQADTVEIMRILRSQDSGNMQPLKR